LIRIARFFIESEYFSIFNLSVALHQKSDNLSSFGAEQTRRKPARQQGRISLAKCATAFARAFCLFDAFGAKCQIQALLGQSLYLYISDSHFLQNPPRG
jgi:hypothetical protein